MAAPPVRVFISSTFRDMHAERDHLVTVVFPELRERLDRLGLEFFDVDLRWGVPEEGGDGERANPWVYCKRWIERVEPFFVSILGQRYGWKPPGEEIVDADDRSRYEGLSITEMEIRHAVLDGRIRRRSYFYLRDSEVPKATPPEIYAEYVDPEDAARLRDLEQRIAESGRPVRRYPARWTGGGFTDMDRFGSMVLEDLWSGVLRDERFVPAAAWQDALGLHPQEDPWYADETRLIPRDLWESLVKATRPPVRDPLDAEAEEMAAFAAVRLRWFRGRGEQLAAIERFVREPADEGGVCAVRAVPGQGKSALLAAAARRLTGDSDLVITHFVGATERSAEPRWLLERLVAELEGAGIVAPEGQTTGRDVEGLRAELAARLESYEGERRCVVIVDAVNQLEAGFDLGWLPHRLGPGVRVVVSCVDQPSALPDSPEARALAALEMRRPIPTWVELPPLDAEEVRSIVVDYLEEYCKVLGDREIDLICRHEMAGNPLYLLVMLNELRSLGGNDMQRIVPELIASLRGDRPDVERLFEWVLERLEVFGAELVRLWCTYLALGRVGMASGELSDLLREAASDEGARAALRIERSVRRYLQPRGGQIDFFHGQFRSAVASRYLGDPADVTRAHRSLASYFRSLADPDGTARWEGGSPRGLGELPFHLTEAAAIDPEAWEQLYAVLTDIRFLEHKASEVGIIQSGGEASTGVYDVLDDISRAAALSSGMQEPHRRPVFVTATRGATGPQIRCPHCGRVSPYRVEWSGRDVACPREDCGGPWVVTPFVAIRPFDQDPDTTPSAPRRAAPDDLLKLPPP